MTAPRAIDKDGNEYRVPSNLSVWERMEAVGVTMNREDLRFIIWNLRHSAETNQKMLEVLKKAKTDSVTAEDRMILQENMRDFDNEQLIEQIDSWISYVDTFNCYADKLEEIRGTGPKDPDGHPNVWDWKNCQVGINGIANSE